MGQDYESDAPATTPPLPQVPECDVERLDDGRLRITHKTSGETVTVDGGEDVDIQAVLLRCGAAWQPQLRPVQWREQLRHIHPRWRREAEFRTGDPS